MVRREVVWRDRELEFSRREHDFTRRELDRTRREKAQYKREKAQVLLYPSPRSDIVLYFDVLWDTRIAGNVMAGNVGPVRFSIERGALAVRRLSRQDPSKQNLTA